MTRQTTRCLAALALIWAACTACANDDARKAAELNWGRPEPGQPWCQVLDDFQVAALVDTSGDSGSPWQQLHSGTYEWSCTIAATMRGRGLDQAETPPPLLTIHARLLAPKTPQTIKAGNYVPVGSHFSAPPSFFGHGTWAAESAGEYLTRRNCHRAHDLHPTEPDELQVQLHVNEPNAIEPADLRQATAAAWTQAAEAHGCCNRDSRRENVPTA